MEDAVPLEEIATHIDALMAADAAERFEYLIAGQLQRSDRIGFARKPSVETTTRRNEGSFICRDSIQHGSGIGLTSVSVTELPHGLRVGPQFADGLLHA